MELCSSPNTKHSRPTELSKIPLRDLTHAASFWPYELQLATFLQTNIMKSKYIEFNRLLIHEYCALFYGYHEKSHT